MTKIIFSIQRTDFKKSSVIPGTLFAIQIYYFFATIEDKFNYFKDIFGNSYQKEHAIEKF